MNTNDTNITPAAAVIRTIQAAPPGLPITVAIQADAATQSAIEALLEDAVVETVKDNPRGGFAKTLDNFERVEWALERAQAGGAPLVLLGTADALGMLPLPTAVVVAAELPDVVTEPARTTVTSEQAAEAFERNVGALATNTARQVTALAIAAELAGLGIPQDTWEGVLGAASARTTDEGRVLIRHLAAAHTAGEYLGPVVDGVIAVRRDAARRVARRNGLAFTSAGLAAAMAPHVVPGTTAGRRAPLGMGFENRELSFVLPLEAVQA